MSIGQKTVIYIRNFVWNFASTDLKLHNRYCHRCQARVAFNSPCIMKFISSDMLGMTVTLLSTLNYQKNPSRQYNLGQLACLAGHAIQPRLAQATVVVATVLEITPRAKTSQVSAHLYLQCDICYFATAAQCAQSYFSASS